MRADYQLSVPLSDPHPAILVDDLQKTYVVPEREAGLRASMRSLMRRRTRQVKAVDGIRFAIAPGEAP